MTGPGAEAEAGAVAPAAPAAVAGWEGASRSTQPLGAPVLSVGGVEGPLDWLVEMARTRKLDLSKLSILALVEAFGAAMTEALGRDEAARPAPDLARWADWLTLAADLVRLRSDLLLPSDAPAARAAHAEAEALRRALAGRAEAAAAAAWLERRPQLGQEVFARGRPEAAVPGPAQRAGEGTGPAPAVAGDLTALLRACLVALRVPAEASAWQPAQPALWRVADAAARIGEVLGRVPGGTGAELGVFLPRIGPATSKRELRCKAAVASTLLAAMELARDGSLILEQSGSWTAIQAQRRWPGDGTQVDR